MPLEFALRPRIRLSEGFAPPRRSRFRLPKLALPIAAYWLTAGGITYALIHLHDQPDAPTLAQSVAPEAKPERRWWQPAPARSERATTESEPAPAPLAAPAAEVAPAETAPAPPEPAPEMDDTLAAPEPAAARTSPLADEELGPAVAANRERRRTHASRARELDAPRGSVASDARSLTRGGIPAADLFPAPSLEPPPAREAPPLLGATPPDAPAAVASALPSCEAAAAAASQAVDLAHRDNTPDLSRDAIASVLDNGVWIARCDIPMSSSIDLCVAIQGGAVIGVSVTSRPASAAISACVKRRAAGLHFPFSARVDLAKTHF